jgi:beta-aspartyl-peptidase (threonine type)
MQQSPHVMLAGSGAEAFARSIGMPAVNNTSFTTPRREQQLQRAKQRLTDQANLQQVVSPHKWGTVGAVALDSDGNLAAATSTGGMTAKRWGRIGDSPIIGAGTFADNRSCAVSATGHGEYFIRYNVAADICARVRYLKETIGVAAQHVLFDELLPVGGTGGVIVMNPKGEIVMPFNTPGMYRGAIDVHGNLQLGIFETANERQ